VSVDAGGFVAGGGAGVGGGVAATFILCLWAMRALRFAIHWLNSYHGAFDSF